MATSDIIIRIRSDERGFSTELTTAQLNRLSQQAERASRNLRDTGSAFQAFGSAMKDTVMYGGAYELVSSLASIPSKAREAADAYTDIQSQLTLATSNANELAVANDRLFQMSQNNRVAFADTVKLYSGISMPLKEAGKSQEQILKFTDLVGKALQVSGSGAAEQASVIRQLGQAMASGVLRGDEFNSIMENGKAVSLALADGLGKTTGELRGMAEKGLLKSGLVFEALMSQAAKVNDKFSKIAPTMEKAWVTISNSALLEIGKLDQATGISASIAKNLTSVAANMDSIFSVGLTSAGVLAALLAGRGVSSLTAYTAAKASDIAASRAQSIATAQAAVTVAQAATEEAAAQIRKAQAKIIDTSATARQMTMMREAVALDLAAARGTDGYTAAVVRLSTARAAEARAVQVAATARAEYTAATAASTAATNALTVAQGNAAAASSLLATAGRGLSSVFALVGGPVGAVVLALAGAAYYISKSNAEMDASKGAIKGAKGEWIKYADITDQAKQINQEYLGASESVRKELKEQSAALQKNTQDAYDNAKAKLALLESELAKAKTQTIPAYDSNGEAIYTEENGYAVDWQGAGQAEIDVATKRLSEQQNVVAELKKQLEGVKEAHENIGKPAKEAASTIASGAETAAKAIHDHGDALKSLIEGITKQRIELEHGKLAAEYYASRLNGLTDAEARAAVGASQYNTFLEKRRDLQRRQAALSGSVAQKVLAEFDQAGLLTNLNQLDLVKPVADRAVLAANRYQSAIDAVTASANTMGSAVTAAMATSSGAGVTAAASLGKAAGTAQQVVAILMQLGESKKNAISIAANLKQESEFNSRAVGDGGAAYGLAQWHADRQADFKSVFGKDIRSSTMEEQLRFVVYELRKGNERPAGRKLDATTNAQDGAAAVSRFYERPEKVEVEMARRAGIATQIANSLGGAATATQDMTAASSKAIPVWETLNTSTSKTKEVLVEYGGKIDDARVSGKDVADLFDGEMGYAAGELVKTARDHAAAATLTGYAYRQQQIVAMELGAELSAMVTNEETRAAFAEEQANLQKERTAFLNPGMANDYTRGLQDKNLTDSQIGELRTQKVSNEYEKTLTEQQRQREELTMTAEAYRRLTLERDGYNKAQINGLIAGDAEIRRLQDARKLGDDLAGVFRDEITSGMQNMLHTGNSILDALIDKLIESIMTSYTMEQMFNSFGAGIGGLFGFSSGGSFSATGTQVFAKGGAFNASAIRAFAQGDTFHNAVLTSPTLFHLPSGRQAVAGEAGAEAIMPMPQGGIITKVLSGDGSETVMHLPLTRVGGNLAAVLDMQSLQPFATGGAFDYAPRANNGGSRANANTGSSIPKVVVNITNNGQPVKAADTRMSQNADGSMQLDILLDQIEARQAQNVRYGNGQLDSAMRDTYGLRRIGG